MAFCSDVKDFFDEEGHTDPDIWACCNNFDEEGHTNLRKLDAII